ncbi:hypothetical protein LCGC14_1685150, partial [marine sediment metagenome]
MQKTPPGKPIKLWSDWSAGVGHLVDDSRVPGMAYASALLGLRGELRPAPFLNVVTTSLLELVMSWLFDSSASTSFGVAAALQPASGETVAPVGTATGGGAGSSPLTFSYTVPAGANRAIVVVTMGDTGSNPSGVTFDGDALTLIRGRLFAGTTISIWVRVAPTVTTGNVVITQAGAGLLVGGATSYVGVHQSTPSNDDNDSAILGSSGPMTFPLTGVQNGYLVDGMVLDSGTEGTPSASQTDLLDQNQAGIDLRMSEKAVSSGEHHFQYFFEATANSNDAHPFLYALRGFRLGSNVTLHKVDLSNGDFATFEAGSKVFTVDPGQIWPGQPAKYEGFWWLPAGNNNTPRKLSVVGTGDVTTDTLDSPASPFVPGSEHITAFGNQMAIHMKEGVSGVPGLPGIGANDGGVSILKVGGAPATASNWGSVFPVGDVTDRAAGLVNHQGATFVLMPDGLYSFNSKGRSGLVHGSLGAWENAHINIPMSTYKGSIVIPHPSGLLLYTLGEEPINIGVDVGATLGVLPPSGVTELHGGIHHSTDTVSDFIYEVYQPDNTSTSALLLCGYQAGRDFVWQSLGTLTLLDPQFMLGCKVARNGRSESKSHVTPTLWTQSGSDLVYMKLDPAASPFHARSDPHKVVTSGEAWLSELILTEPVDLTGMVVVVSEDMTTGDEWQISMVSNGSGKDSNIGWVKTGGRHVLKVERHSVTRLSLHIKFTGTSAADRVPPALKEISLFGT